MQMFHMVFHERKLLCPGAVAGVVLRGVTVQIPGIAFERVIERQLGEMEAADQDIGLKPVDDIQYSLVRTAAEQDFSAAFFDEKVLFMAEIFRVEDAVFQPGKAESAQIVFLPGMITGMECYAVGKDGVAFGKDQPFMLHEGSIQADVFCGAMIVGLEGMTIYVDGSGIVLCKEAGEAAAVIVVAVGQNGDIHRRKVNTERGGIAREEVGLTHIKKNFVACGLDIQA